MQGGRTAPEGSPVQHDKVEWPPQSDRYADCKPGCAACAAISSRPVPSDVCSVCGRYNDEAFHGACIEQAAERRAAVIPAPAPEQSRGYFDAAWTV